MQVVVLPAQGQAFVCIVKLTILYAMGQYVFSREEKSALDLHCPCTARVKLIGQMCCSNGKRHFAGCKECNSFRKQDQVDLYRVLKLQTV
jgi:hypothetical protein